MSNELEYEYMTIKLFYVGIRILPFTILFILQKISQFFLKSQFATHRLRMTILQVQSVFTYLHRSQNIFMKTKLV